MRTPATSSASSRRLSAPRHHEQTRLPEDFDFGAVRGLSNEVRQKLVRSPADPRPGGTHSRRDAGGDFAAFGASQEAHGGQCAGHADRRLESSPTVHESFIFWESLDFLDWWLLAVVLAIVDVFMLNGGW